MEKEYDFIVIAVKRELLYFEIKEELKAIGVSEDKILWEFPKLLMK